MKEFVAQQIVKTEKELNSLRDFLRMNQLPADDLKITDSVYLTYYNADDVLVGSGGLEFYGDKALLRSLAVSQAMRSQSLGKQIVDELIRQVKETGMKEIYLLTTTAYFFFLKFGFIEIQRADVPEEVKASTEFSQLCPASAHVMKLTVN